MIGSAGSRLLLAVAVTAGLAVVLTLAAGALAALPALLAFLPLLAGRYPGAVRLERLIEARAPAVSRRPLRSAPRPRAATMAALLPRGGRLLASSLAKRPPPLASALS